MKTRLARFLIPMAFLMQLPAPALCQEVRSVQADAHPRKYGRQQTVGSSSVRRGAWIPLRQAGAAWFRYACASSTWA